MSTITWNTDVNAPCCPGEIVSADGRTILVQTDWDYPSVAQSFGWSLAQVQKQGHACDHAGTDGTINCPECGMTVSQFIGAAYDWLRDHNGATADDPGYFNGRKGCKQMNVSQRVYLESDEFGLEYFKPNPNDGSVLDQFERVLGKAQSTTIKDGITRRVGIETTPAEGQDE